MDNEIKKQHLDILFGAVQIACICIPAIFLGQVLLLFADSYISIAIILYGQPIISALCLLIISFSGNIFTSFMKCVISLPLSVMLWLITIKTKFFLRAVNWVIPDYGDVSAGGGFGLVVSFLFTMLACAVAMLISMGMSAIPAEDKCSKPLAAWSKRVCLVLCGVTLGAFILLTLFMPQYHGELG